MLSGNTIWKAADMALSIKTAEADRLARELSRLTGETMTDAVTKTLSERLERERAIREADKDLPARSRRRNGTGPAATRTEPRSSSGGDHPAAQGFSSVRPRP